MSTLHEQLLAIRDERGGLTPALVVDTARDPAHPLHSRFEWDDAVAGERWRLEQASALIRSVKIAVDPARPADLRAFVAVKGRETHRADYVPTQEAMRDEFTRRLVLEDMRREWRALKRRYDHMVEFAEMIAAEPPAPELTA